MEPFEEDLHPNTSSNACVLLSRTRAHGKTSAYTSHSMYPGITSTSVPVVFRPNVSTFEESEASGDTSTLCRDSTDATKIDVHFQEIMRRGIASSREVSSTDYATSSSSSCTPTNKDFYELEHSDTHKSASMEAKFEEMMRRGIANSREVTNSSFSF